MPSTPYTIVLGFLSFLLIGLEQSLLGPSFASFSAKFILDPAKVSEIVSAQFLGIVAGTLCTGLLLRSQNIRSVTVECALSTTLGIFLMAFAPQWYYVLIGSFLGGLGYGGLSATFNTLFSTFGAKSAIFLNLLNATWGIGSMLGPLWAATLLPYGLTGSFGILGGFFALVTLAFIFLNPNLKFRPQENDKTKTDQRVSPWWAVSFACLLALYSATEASVGNWMTTHLTSLIGTERTTLYSTLFWAALTAGRFIAAPISLKLHPSQLVLGSSVAMLLTSSLLHHPQWAPYGYILFGLSCAPIFATTVAWFGRALPTLTFLTPYLMASGGLGGAILPRWVGNGVKVQGISAIPWGITLGSLCLLGVVLFNLFRYRPESRAVQLKL